VTCTVIFTKVVVIEFMLFFVTYRGLLLQSYLPHCITMSVT